jgi:tetratricopeptide (TPR) repeat protein/predicted Ser/Thr protein kinase
MRYPAEMSTDAVERSDALETRLVAAGAAERDGSGTPATEASRGRLVERLFGSPAQAVRLGRYLVLEQIGAGGLGVVYSAFDPELDRKVAIKLMRVRRGGAEDTDEARDRLLREARALAKLAHPNVVPVFDAGTTGRDVFIVMELVDGQDLRKWLEIPRTRAEILRVLGDAGRGLAAAHAAGIVHRDFKPANVILGSDGRARVVDFGLARWLGVASAVADPVSPAGSNDELTRAGTLMGTPPYLAPELHDGATADERSDVYAFCVTLFEALHGIRPFRGERPDDVLRAKRAGLAAAPSRARPRWLSRLLQRGLHPVVSSRFQSMPELLRALERGRRSRSRAAWLAAIVLAAGSAAYAHGVREDPCAAASQPIDAVWNDDAALQLREAFTATGKVYAEDSYAAIRATLDQRAAAWSKMARDACEAAHFRRQQSLELFDRRMLCLDRRRTELAATVEALATVDASSLPRAAEATAALEPIDDCGDVERLLGDPHAPRSDEHIALEREIESLEVALRLSPTADHRVRLSALRDATAALQAWDLDAAAWLLLGIQHMRRAEYPQARDAMVEALLAAERAGHDARRVSALSALVSVVGVGLDQPESAELFVAQAEAILARSPSPQAWANLHTTKSLLATARGRFDEALASAQEAFELRAAERSEPDLMVANARLNLAVVLGELGRHEEALAELDRVATSYEATVGPHHPNLATVQWDICVLRSRLDDLAGAISACDRAVAIAERALAADHPDLATALVNRASVLARGGRHAAALDDAERALALRSAALGQDHVLTARAHVSVGAALLEVGQHERAADHAERAREVLARQRRRTDDVAAADFVLARALATSDPPRARALAEGALAVLATMPAHEHSSREIEAWLRSHR